jgi:hypothetical protein
MVFHNDSTGTSAAASYSSVAMAYAGSHVAASVPQQVDPDARGLFVGGSLGVTVTNAGNAQQLQGPFNNFQFNVGIGPVGVSIAKAKDPKTGDWTFSATAGPWPGAGISFVESTTNTPASSIKSTGECK